MRERALTVEDDVTVAFHKVVSHDNQSRFCNDQEEDALDDVEQTEETVHLRTNCFKDEDAEEEQGARGSETVLEGGGKETLLCLPAFCVRGKKTASSGEQKIPAGRSVTCVLIAYKQEHS
ncbi:hypothetical protein GOODEAATRI_013546 [Goodea atripinnis]|uniref:Uncharacterized protein n=1 Tax=Goodea atripinnis TaxID=208336 RepID=A0ABV0PNB9_9TELE